MAYVLVMGGLALSVSFTLGWILWRAARWAWGLVAAPPARRGVKPRARARKAPAARKAAARPSAKPAPREPWGLTRWLSRRHSAPPLASLALILYGLTRVAEFGMTQRPLSPPAGYHRLVDGLGWLAAGLLALALMNLLARWRCREE
ncbi:hypothetical protein ACFFU2_04185 [Halomonas alkalicola]|uniref:Uncharacterized protein n=1 Tax=Halomonas alkalicola TaxID=1930622 RepID=A0ABY9H5Q5_9GAMM|nr:hypothetical protein [Halomonas alkalicola]WLI73822.1 hypothetical protein B6N23_02480 [Halomonas alkalicola]